MGMFDSFSGGSGGLFNMAGGIFGDQQKGNTSQQFGYGLAPQSEESNWARGYGKNLLQGYKPSPITSDLQSGATYAPLANSMGTAYQQYNDPFNSPTFNKSASTLSDYLGNQYDTRVAPKLQGDAAKYGMTGSTGAGNVMGQAGNDYITNLAAALSQLGLQQQVLGGQTLQSGTSELGKGGIQSQQAYFTPMSQALALAGSSAPYAQTGVTQSGSSMSGNTAGMLGQGGGMLQKLMKMFQGGNSGNMSQGEMMNLTSDFSDSGISQMEFDSLWS